MEIKVYKDASKMKKRILGGLDFRQLIAFLVVLVAFGLMVANTFVWHFPDAIFQPIFAIVFLTSMGWAMFKINKMPIERYIKMRYHYYIKPKIRLYQTERIKKYAKYEFQQGKKVKETETAEVDPENG